MSQNSKPVNRKFLRCARIACAAGLLMLAASPVLAIDSEIPTRLLTEEQRQLQNSQRLEQQLDKLAETIDDIKENELFDQANGPKMMAVGKVLELVRANRVPLAVDFLKKARIDLINSKGHLTGADQEIQNILNDLQKLLFAYTSNAVTDSLLAELRVIIKKQTELREKTVDWGKQVLQGAADLDGKVHDLSAGQKDIDSRIVDFGVKLHNAAEAEAEPTAKERLTKGDKFLTEKNAKSILELAATNIDSKEPVGAAGQQDKGLVVLKELEKILEGEETADKPNQEQIDKLQKLVDAQKNLEQEIKAADPAQLPDLQVEQVKLEAELKDVQAQAGTPDLNEAKADMQAAAQALQNGEQQQADNAANEAAKALEKALNQEAGQPDANQQQADAGQPEPADPADAGQEPPDAGQQEADAGQHEGHEPGQPHDGPPHDGPPHPGQGTELSLSNKTGPKIGPPHPALQSTDGQRMFGNSTKAGGEAVARTQEKINNLASRDRGPVLENYARELPPEYNTLLKDYYEALAK